MKKKDFLIEIQSALALETEIGLDSPIEIDSLGSLMLIAFLDEKFNIRVKSDDIKSISNVRQIIDIIGEDKIR